MVSRPGLGSDPPIGSDRDSGRDTRPVPMSGFMKKEFVPGKLKPEYALMNKIIHNRIWPKGSEKSPSQEQI